MREDLLKAIECCKEKKCGECPVFDAVCDEIRVNMIDLPEELVMMIEEELEDQDLTQ